MGKKIDLDKPQQVPMRSRIPRPTSTVNQKGRSGHEDANSEEVFALDGDYDANEEEDNVMEGFSINERFQENAKEYFEDKVFKAIFRNVWSGMSEELTGLLEHFGEKVITDSIDMLSISSRESSAVANHSFEAFRANPEPFQ